MDLIGRLTSGGSRAFASIRLVLANPKLMLYPLFLFIPVAGFFAVLVHSGYIDILDLQGMYNLERFYSTLSFSGKWQFALCVGLLFLPLLVVVNIALAQCAKCVIQHNGVRLADSLRFGVMRLWAGMPILVSLIAFLFFLLMYPQGLEHVLLHALGLVLFYFAFPVLADHDVPSLQSIQTSVRMFMHNIVEVAAGSAIFVAFAMLGSFILLHFGGVLGIVFAYWFGAQSLVTVLAAFALPLFWLLLITASGMVFAVDLYQVSKA